MAAVKLKARDVLDALLVRHGIEAGDGSWACVEEAFCGWRSAGGGIDLFAMAVHTSARRSGLAGPVHGPGYVARPKHPVVAYEVKVSRSDFRREVDGVPDRFWTEESRAKHWMGRYVKDGDLKERGRPGWPSKARHALDRSNYFVFATPKGLLTKEERERREPWGDASKRLWLPPEAGLFEVGARGGVTVAVPAPLRAARDLRTEEIAELIRHGTTPATMRNAVAKVKRLEETIESLRSAIEDMKECR